MNLCCLMGKIISDIEFRFVLKSANISIAIFYLKVEENCIVMIKAYDELADWCYQNLSKNDWISLIGKLNSKMEIIMHDINYL